MIIIHYTEDNLEKYYNKDCVYIIHIKDNIYKYGNASQIFKRLQTYKTNLKYNKIIKIYKMNNMNESLLLEKKIKSFVKLININTIYNNHIEIFEIDNINLNKIINKIDELKLNIIKNNKEKRLYKLNLELEYKIKQLEIDNLRKIEEEKTKQLDLEYKIKQLDISKILKSI